MRRPRPDAVEAGELGAWREALRSLDWRRLAEPQPDGYDANAILALAGRSTTARRLAPYRRTAPPGRLRVAHALGPEERQAAGLVAGYADASLDHPCIGQAVHLLGSWTAGLSQVRILIETLHPALDLSLPAVLPVHVIHSASHSSEESFGTLWATVNSALGLAQSVVHEMAHHKLCALGVSTDGADAVVANPDAAVYPSPLVGHPRPMSAVLHAHYALLHVLALDGVLLKIAHGASNRTVLSRSFARHATLLARSARTIRASMVVDAFGASFMPGVWDWMERVLVEARHHAA